MLRSYKQVVFLSLVSYGACVNAALVGINSVSFSGGDISGREGSDYYSDYWRSYYGRNIEWHDDTSDDESHGDSEHENDFPHGFKGVFGGRNKHKNEERHFHAHLSPGFPHNNFPFGKFPVYDFPREDFLDKFKNYPNPWIDTDIDVDTVSTVPIPAAVWLFGSGLISLLAVSRRRKERR